MKKASPFLLIIVLFAAASWYFFAREPEAVHEVVPPPLPPAAIAETQQTQAQPEEETVYQLPEPEPEPEIVEPLPLLNESDPEITRALTDVVGNETLTEYLVNDQIISRVVATIDSLTSRQVPAQINPVKPAGAGFIVDTEGESVVLSPRNFARYNGYVALVEAADAAVMMQIYQRYTALFQEAFEQNGGEGLFDDRLQEVIDTLLETPDVPGPVYLTKPEAFYLFEDPELEAMTAGQKILIRMGSANAEIVKQKLGEIKSQLNP